MIRIPRHSGLSLGLSAAFAAAALLGQASAQNIPNPGFEANSFTAFPGYISLNAPITGWTADPDTAVGLNPAGTSPFADNGVIPQGNNVAFIQSSGGPASLSTTITGLNPGTRYRLQFRLNARGGQNGRLTVLVDEQPLGVSDVASVGGTAPYKWVGVEFDAQATETTLRLENSTGGDNTVVVDDFTIAPTTNDWSYEPWTGDEDSGVDPVYLYTHAYSFNSGANPIINEVRFTGIPGTQPAVAGKFSTTGFSVGFGNDSDNTLSGESLVLGNDFIYNGFPSTITLNGLTPGKDYVLSLYSTGWEGAGARIITFRDGNSALTIDQDAFSTNNGIRIIHNYKADASGNATIFTHPLPNASFHLYGLANREATPSTTPVFAVAPQNVIAVQGDAVTLTHTVAGTRPLTVEWLKDGVVIPGETGVTLLADSANADGVVDASDRGLYSVRATNASGTTTSPVGFLGVYVPSVGPLFSTGVGLDGAALDPGQADPHYRVMSEPGGGGPSDALVQSGIPSPPWIANTPDSQWIGFTENTGSGAPGDYVYATTVDLTGVDVANYALRGRWAVDNAGTFVKVNGTAVAGFPLSNGFGAYTLFEQTAAELGLTAGANTLEFGVNNGTPAGPTGLRIDSLKVPDGIAPYILVHPVGGTIVSGLPVTLTSSAFGSGALKYQWTKGGADIAGATGKTFSIPVFTQANEGVYAVKVTNSISTVTSTNAQLTASNIPPVVNVDPVGGDLGTFERVTLSVGVTGSEPFTYQWQFNGAPIAGATGSTFTINSLQLTDSGSYSVNIKNPYGEDTSDGAVINVRNAVPGVFNTGVDDSRVPLADGANDPHYVLFANPDAPGAETPIQAVVEDSTVFPISTGTWLFNSPTSKWVGPRLLTSASAGEGSDDGEGPGIYGFRMTVDMTGYDPSTAEMVGKWAVDNFVDAVRVNGEVVPGVTNTLGFASYQNFKILATDAQFVSGVNIIDFLVHNAGADVGYIGLRIDGVKIFAEPAVAAADKPPVTISLSANGRPVVRVAGVAGKNYRILRSTALAPTWTEVLAQFAPAGGVIEFTDTNAPAGRAFYIVEFETP